MFALFTKWVSVLIMLGTVIALHLGVLPPYHTFTKLDKWLWVVGLGSLTLLQIIFLICKVHKCYSCRIWSDFTLQLTGLVFICLSAVFGLTYPPFSWAMGVFPVVGVSYLVVGRIFSQRSRHCLREYNGTLNKII